MSKKIESFDQKLNKDFHQKLESIFFQRHTCPKKQRRQQQFT